MRILLLGCNGQVGWELQRSLAPLGEVIALERRMADLARPDSVIALIGEMHPQAVVNAAAYTAVDRAESEPQMAHAINAVAPGMLARACAQSGATFVHFSTDYVFDGSGREPRDESAQTGPINTYGRSKLEGEVQVRASGCRHLLLRTSWVYGSRGSNFPRTMLRLAAEREQIDVVDDQFGAPTSAPLIADVTAHALKAVIERPELCGTYHVAAAGETSWHGLATFVVERARARGAPIRIAPDAIRPISSDSYAAPARRPANSRLDTGRLRSTFGLHLPAWQAGIERLVDELVR